jgi:hypothetical protein
MMKFVELHRAKLPDWQIPRDGQVSILMVHDPRGGHCTLPGDEVVLRELAQWIRSNRPDWKTGLGHAKATSYQGLFKVSPPELEWIPMCYLAFAGRLVHDIGSPNPT